MAINKVLEYIIKDLKKHAYTNIGTLSLSSAPSFPVNELFLFYFKRL